MTLPPGTRLGSHEIVAPIGAGGMGEVYRATGILAKAQERAEAFRKSENERVPSSTPTGDTR
jgi:hypothetical protein